jgi:hypothetical protein
MNMNEELQKSLASLLSKANSGIDNAGEFLASELPDVIQQLLMWHGAHSFIVFIVGIITLATAIILPVKAYNGRLIEGHWASPCSAYEEISLLGVAAMSLSLVGFFASMAFINIEWLQIWIAPKVWLVEYAAKIAA